MVKHTSLFFFPSLSTHFQIHPNPFLSSSHLEKKKIIVLWLKSQSGNLWAYGSVEYLEHYNDINNYTQLEDTLHI